MEHLADLVNSVDNLKTVLNDDTKLVISGHIYITRLIKSGDDLKIILIKLAITTSPYRGTSTAIQVPPSKLCLPEGEASDEQHIHCCL